MELGGVDIVLPHGGREGLAVGGFGGYNAGIARFGIEAVNEIDVRVLIDAAKDGAIRAFDFELVPTDLRNFESVAFLEAHNPSTEQAESSGATIEFVAGFEEGLIADADAKERSAGFDKFQGGVDQFLFAEGVDAIIERADTGKDQCARVADFVWARDDANIRADILEGFVNATEISRAVIDE